MRRLRAEPGRKLKQYGSELSGVVERRNGVAKAMPALVERFGGEMLVVDVSLVAKLRFHVVLHVFPQ